MCSVIWIGFGCVSEMCSEMRIGSDCVSWDVQCNVDWVGLCQFECAV